MAVKRSEAPNASERSKVERPELGADRDQEVGEVDQVREIEDSPGPGTAEDPVIFSGEGPVFIWEKGSSVDPGSHHLHRLFRSDKPVLPFRHYDLEPCTFTIDPGFSHCKTGYGEYFPGQE